MKSEEEEKKPIKIFKKDKKNKKRIDSKKCQN